ncbi:hypothetical protein PR048_011410 [Dryococelus australis]|uniref:Uncharacterized protein n=1 Tax=Dryococelus australis TaxID=614101 RepID=A0ABQ9HLJ0_9NEOP|nr:hypothetical protein PR048_011410 [Dryococelus australis]
MGRWWNARVGEMGVSQENTPASSIVQHNFHMQKSVNPPGIKSRLPRWETSALATAPPPPHITVLYTPCWVQGVLQPSCHGGGDEAMNLAVITSPGRQED